MDFWPCLRLRCLSPPPGAAHPSGTQRKNETLQAIEAFFNIGEVRRVTDAEVALGAERRSRDGGDFFGFEQAGAEVGALQSSSADIGEEVEGSLAVDAGDTWDAVEFLPGVAPAFGVFGEPAGEVLLGAVEGGDGAFLGEAGGIGRGMALDGVDGFGDGIRGGEKAQTPTGHGPGFGEAMNDDGVGLMVGAEARDGPVHRSVVEEVLVDFVAHDEDAMFHAKIAQGADFLGGVDASGGIAGGIEDKQPSAGSQGGAELVGGDLEFGAIGGWKDDGGRAGQLHHFGVTQPIGGRDDDVVAFLAGGEDDVVAGVFAAAGNDDLAGRVGEAILALELVGDGLAKLRDAAGGCVLGEASVQGIDSGLLDVIGGVEVGFARAESDDIFAGGFHGLGFGVDGEGQGRGEGGGAAGDRVVHDRESESEGLSNGWRSARRISGWNSRLEMERCRLGKNGPILRNAMKHHLDFERPLIELQQKLDELRRAQQSNPLGLQLEDEIGVIEAKLAETRRQIYAKLTAWQRVQLARHPLRPYFLDYARQSFTDFSELHGDRLFADDHAMMGGFARLGEYRVMLIGTQKGRDTKENILRNFGSAHPEGYRKALRLMRMADRFGLPIITLIDTAGAYPGVGAEERHIAEAIAVNLREMMRLEVPIVVAVVGEGGSGGALGIGVGDRVLMLENAYYSVISPEGCAAILWKDKKAMAQAAASLRITGRDLLEFKLVDEVIPEPDGGAHHDPAAAAAALKASLLRHLRELSATSGPERLRIRYQRFRGIGHVTTRTRSSTEPNSTKAAPPPMPTEEGPTTGSVEGELSGGPAVIPSSETSSDVNGVSPGLLVGTEGNVPSSAPPP